MIQNFCVKSWFIVNAIVGNCSIGTTEFVIINTVCQTAKGKGFCIIRISLSIYHFVGYQCADAKFLTIFHTYILSDKITGLHGTGVKRKCDSGTHGYVAFTSFNSFSTTDIIIFIINDRSKCHLVQIQSRCICCKNFKSRSRLSLGTFVCTIQTETG